MKERNSNHLLAGHGSKETATNGGPVMASATRGLLSLMLVSLSGNVTGLSFYYLSHIEKFVGLKGCQIVLIIMATTLAALAEALIHERPDGEADARQRTYVLQFLISLLITLLVTMKPL